MHQFWKRCGQVVAFLLVSPCLFAASFDCQRVTNVVERNICQDETLSRLDSQMADSYEHARRRSGTHAGALLRDQRNWLSQRNATAVDGAGPAILVYKGRIEFLDKLFQGKATTSPLLAAIEAHVAGNPKASVGRGYVISGWSVIGGDGSVFTMAKEMPVQGAKTLPFRLDDVRNLIADDSPEEYRTLALLEPYQLGGVYSEGGTMHSVTWKLFRWVGHAVQSVDLPRALSDTEWTNLGALVDYKGAAYALSYFDGPLDRSDLTAQHFKDGGWTEDSELELHYDVHLRPSHSYCTEANCAELQAFAEKFVRQFDQSRDVSPLREALSADDSRRFDFLLRHAEGTEGVPRDEAVTSLPAFDGKTRYADDIGYTDFGSMSYYFPVRWQGQLLLGRIGNGAVGWRENEDLLLGIWRWDGQKFVPVLGMATIKERGDFLLSAWIK